MSTTPENSDAEREPSRLAREANEIRADLDRTLDALERKFSPGQLLDRSLGYIREHGSELTRNVGDSVKRNPVPALMTAAGVIWLISSTLSSGKATAGQSAPARRHGSRLRDRAEGMHEEVHAWRDRASDTVSHNVTDAMDAARERTGLVQNRVETLLEEQPLVLGTLAVAIGALIGAMLPSTQYENRTVGQVRDRTLAKAKQVGERQYENLRDKLATHEDVQTSGRVN